MPPQHSVTAPIVFISRLDSAWDLDRALAEKDVVEGAKADEHPLVLYFSGESRYDLDASGTVWTEGEDKVLTPEPHAAREYLKEGIRPRMWTLRRLKFSQVSELLDAPRHRRLMHAFALGVVELVNGPDGLPVKSTRGVPLSEKHLDDIAEALGADLIYEVGEAILRASQAPTSAEKKL